MQGLNERLVWQKAVRSLFSQELLEENRLPNVGADGGHGVQVGETLLVLLGDGQQSSHIPDLMVDVVPPGFGCSFSGSVRDHGH